MSKYKITLNGKAYEIEVEEISESEAKSASTAKATAAAPVAKAVPAAAPAAKSSAAPVSGGAGSPTSWPWCAMSLLRRAFLQARL